MAEAALAYRGSRLHRNLAYGLGLVSATLAGLLYTGFIGQKLSGAIIPQPITTPCSLFFVALAIIFAGLGLAERGEPAPEPEEGDEGPKGESEAAWEPDGRNSASQNHK